jgi:glucose-1-phosphate thymidylyltransferase
LIQNESYYSASEAAIGVSDLHLDLKTRFVGWSEFMKGIVLAGGSGTRLYPITKAISKQLLPVYDKPMIFYPISVLMLAGIRDILIISTPHDLPLFSRLLGTGESLGVNFQYQVQESPRGLADAFIVGESFIQDSRVTLVLGDNIFYGQGFRKILQNACDRKDGATIFAYPVSDPERYGVVEFDSSGRAIGIQEKPAVPMSRFAVPGLYFYDNDVVSIAKNLPPSPRGEIEITDVNLAYLREKRLFVEKLSRGFAWLDTGTHESLLQAGNFIQTIEARQGFKVACLEEIAFNSGFISVDEFAANADRSPPELKKYLLGVLSDREGSNQ